MSDIFDEKRAFDRSKGIDCHLPIRDVLHGALNRSLQYPLLSVLSPEDRDHFRDRVYDVLDRLDSVGFFEQVLNHEINDYRSFMIRVYSPASGVVRYPEPTDFVGGREDVRTARYALEAIIVFSSSLLEFLSQAIGFLFGLKHERHLSNLRNHLRARSGTLPEALVRILDEHESLWQELQEEEFRDRLINVDSGPAAFANNRLRDVAVHYRALRLEGFQLQIRADGSLDERATLEPGASVHTASSSRVEWGLGKGIVPVCHDLLSELTTLVTEVVDTICGDAARKHDDA